MTFSQRDKRSAGSEADDFRGRKLLWLFLGLIPLYVIFFTDWLRPTAIEIVPSVRATLISTRSRRTGLAPIPTNGVCPVIFSLDGRYRLSSVLVTEETSSGRRILWHLKGGWRRSFPSKIIVYGMPVPWMKPAVGNSGPESLRAGVKYRLQVQAGWRKGEATFSTRELPQRPGAP